ncbi:MAG: hypothetical protein ABIQ18_05490 [Umezawaea sp.]
MIPAAAHLAAEDARRVLRGELLAEEVSTAARELAVSWLHRQYLPDVEVGRRIGLSTYTAARIRSRLRLPVRRSDLLEVVSRGA